MNLPDKKYAVIYADPPWSYRQHGTGPKSRGNAAQHYHTMTTDDICALPVHQLAGGGTACFMWATFPQIADEGVSKTEKDRIAKKWTVVPGTAGEKVALCPDCLNDYKLRYDKMFEEFKKER